MTTTQREQAIDLMIEKALTGKHSQLSPVFNKGDKKAYEILAKSFKKFIKGLTKLKAEALRDWRREVKEDKINAIKHLSTVQTANKCIGYYKTEVALIQTMLSEYNNYTWSRFDNLIAHLAGEDRKDIRREDFIIKTEPLSADDSGLFEDILGPKDKD